MREVRARKRGRQWCPSTEKVLVFSVAVPLTVAVIIITGIFIYNVYSSKDKSCESGNCQSDLLRVLNLTDDTVEPCNDFYRFACGRYNDPSNPNIIQSVTSKFAKDLDDIIRGPITSDDPASLAMAKSFFQSCVDTNSDIEERDRSFDKLLDSLGGWPIVNGSQWNEDNFEWWKTASTCAENGLDFDWFIHIGVDKNGDDYTYMLYVGYPIKYMNSMEDDKIERYRRLMIDIAILLGAPLESVVSEVNRTLEFQKQLYKITKDAYDSERRRGRPLNFRMIDLKNQLPEVLWLEFLYNATGQVFRYDDVVNLNSMSYIRELYQLLLRTPKRFQANYIVMKVMDRLWQYLPSPIVEWYEKYHRDTETDYTPLNRTKFCLEETQTRFKGVSDAVYIRNTVDPQVKREVKELVSLIKYRLSSHLRNATWIDEEAKEFASVNITELFEFVGGHDEVFDVEKYEQKLGYTGFEETDKTIIDKITQLNKQTFKKNFEKMGLPIDDATYEPEEVMEDYTDYLVYNTVPQVVPACFLRYEYYDPTRPMYANYGSLASLISSKVTHSFSERLHRFLKNNNRTQWWANSLDADSTEKCYPTDDVVDYYTLLTNNGTIRIEKDFTDNLARDLSFEVYQQWVKEHKSETVAPKYKYNANQFFWIYATQLRCATERETNDEYYGVRREAVNRVLSNSYYFANVFKCPPNSNMNPEEKCQIV